MNAQQKMNAYNKLNAMIDAETLLFVDKFDDTDKREFFDTDDLSTVSPDDVYHTCNQHIIDNVDECTIDQLNDLFKNNDIILPVSELIFIHNNRDKIIRAYHALQCSIIALQ